MVRKAPFLFIALGLALSGCTSLPALSFGSDRERAVGQDYFRSAFACREDLPDQEENATIRQVRMIQFQAPFAQDTIQRRRAFAVVTGDSIAALFTPDQLKARLGEFDIANRGIPGDTTRGLLQRLDQDVLLLAPAVVIISIGGNDVLMGRCFSTALDYTAKIVAHIRSRLPETHIILTSVPPTRTWKANSVTPFYNQQLRRMLEGDPRVHFVDLWPALSERDAPRLKDEYVIEAGGRQDSVHFNERGYAVWAELIRPILAGAAQP